MEHIIVSFVTSQNREFASEFIFNERFELLVDIVPMLRDFSTDLLIEHHLTVNDLIQRLVFLRSKEKWLLRCPCLRCMRQCIAGASSVKLHLEADILAAGIV